MNVIDVMTANPVTIRPNQPLRAAIERMESVHCKHLPVISQSGHLVGVISDRDCRYALNSPFATTEHTRQEDLADKLIVRDVMTAAPIIIEAHIPASEAARLMLTHRIGCLPVMRAETLIGITTRSDLLVAFMNVHRRYEKMLHGPVTLATSVEGSGDSPIA